MAILGGATRWRMRAAIGAGLVALGWPAAAHGLAAAGPVDPDPAPPSGVVVRFKSGADAGERAQARDTADVRRDETLPVAGMEVVTPDPGVSVQESVAALERSDQVAYAEPDVRRTAFATPDDPFFDLEWGLSNGGQTVGGTAGTPDADIDADQAWDTTTGSSDVVVGVVDTGLDVSHPDLAANVWSNPGETGAGRESNGVDDDGDGLIDDRMGWDWAAGDNQPLDENGHGTHVSGTVAGRGDDGTGVAGVAWRASLMPLRILDASGSGKVSDAIKAYGYAAAHGARVVNASLGGGTFSRGERDAIAAASNVLFVVAAGNDGADDDTTPSYPCDYDLPNVVCVAASDQHDALAGFSNYGSKSVDLAAPGVNIASAWPGDQWALLDGTSMATPHVTGTAVLALAANPSLDTAGLRAALLSSVDPLPAFAAKVATGGRLNAARAVAAAAGTPPPDTAAGAQAPRPSAPSTPAPTAPQPTTPAPPVSPAAPAPAPAPTAPTAAPAQTVAPARAPDRIAPSLTLTVPARLTPRRALTSGVRVTARCSERCTVRLTLVADAATARRLGLARGGRAVTVARGEAHTTADAAVTRTLRLAVAARRHIAHARTVRLRLTAQANDAAGNRRTRTATVTLRTP
jgi:subtilisin family serine protease